MGGLCLIQFLLLILSSELNGQYEKYLYLKRDHSLLLPYLGNVI